MINNTAVTDLTALEHLESIEYVNANSTQLREISTAAVAVEKLKVMNTALGEDKIAAFRKAIRAARSPTTGTTLSGRPSRHRPDHGSVGRHSRW